MSEQGHKVAASARKSHSKSLYRANVQVSMLSEESSAAVTVLLSGV